jgi:hypothetical protein
LRFYEERIANMCAGRDTSGVGTLVDEQKRIEGELEAAAKEACGLRAHSEADFALQAASLMAVKPGIVPNRKHAPDECQRRSREAELRRGGSKASTNAVKV